MDAMKNVKAQRSSVYRVGGGRGLAIVELERRGLVEAKIFSGERGRGGSILKLRICYQKEDFKRRGRQRSFCAKKESDFPDF